MQRDAIDKEREKAQKAGQLPEASNGVASQESKAQSAKPKEEGKPPVNYQAQF